MDFSYPKTVNKKKWIEYLGRQLTHEESHILSSVVSENIMNRKLDSLRDSCNNIIENNKLSLKEGTGLTIPTLTTLVGNCMFESLNYHGIGNSVTDLRKGLSYLMHQFRNIKLFSGQTLYELFTSFNDIEYVCSNNRLYKYDYDIMCKDLSNDKSWSKLPTQLILMVISHIYNIKIIIINDKSQLNEIYSRDGNSSKTIYIGHMLESHYVPLNTYVISESESNEYIYYNDSTDMFKLWAMREENKKIKKIIKIHKKNMKQDNLILDVNDFVNP